MTKKAKKQTSRKVKRPISQEAAITASCMYGLYKAVEFYREIRKEGRIV